MAIRGIPEDLEIHEVPIKVNELNLRLNSLSLAQIITTYIIPTRILVLTIKEMPDLSDISQVIMLLSAHQIPQCCVTFKNLTLIEVELRKLLRD